MGRRTSGAQVGLEKIGNVQANATTLSTTQTNADLTLDPNGTGGVIVNGDVTIADQGDLRLRESVANGTNYLAMQAAANMASNYTITWPAAVAGTSGFVLSSDTSGNLSWVSQTTAGLTSSDSGSSATVHYPFFGTNSGSIPTGQLTAFNVNSSLSFQPSTGTLAATVVRSATVDGSASNSGTLTLRGTSSATKATASILMNENIASSSTTTGTLVVTGGVGIGGALNVSSTASFGNTLTVTTGGLNVTGTLTANSGTSGIIGYTTRTSSVAIPDADGYNIVANSGAITLTLPATSTNGRTLIFADGNNFTSNNVTLGRNGRTIDGLAEDLVLNVRGSYVILVYYNTDWKAFVL